MRRAPFPFLGGGAFVVSALVAGAASAADRDGVVLAERYDFGRIANNAPVDAKLSMRNEGPKELSLVGVHVSCGCLHVEVSPESIVPGKSAEVSLHWDPRGKLGANEKTVVFSLRRGRATFERKIVVSAEVFFAGKAGTVFEGSCNACHGLPAAGKKGDALYSAACAMCHGLSREGVRPSPALPASEADFPPRSLFDRIYDGNWDRGMPGFGLKSGGPLDSSQVSSLVRFLREAPRTVSATALPAQSRGHDLISTAAGK